MSDAHLKEMLAAPVVARFEIASSQLAGIEIRRYQLKGHHLGYGDYETAGDELGVDVSFDSPMA